MPYLLLIGMLFVGSMLSAQSPFRNALEYRRAPELLTDSPIVITEDSLGFFWIGTYNGFCRFDGRLTEVFRHDKQDSTSFAGRRVHDILVQDPHRLVWIAHDQGLSRYDPSTGHFVNYRYADGTARGLPDEPIHSLCKAKDLWVGSRGGGLYRYRPDSDDFEAFRFTAPGVDRQYLNHINAIRSDPEDQHILWLGTMRGLIRFDTQTGQYRHYHLKLENRELQEEVNAIAKLYFHDNGNLYFGGWQYGVYVFNPGTGQFFTDEWLFPNENVNLLNICHKSRQEIWISTRKALKVYNTYQKKVTQSWPNDAEQRVHYSVDHVDRKGRIWSIVPKDAASEVLFRIYDPLVNQLDVQPYTDAGDLMCLTRKIIEDTLRQRLYVLPQECEGLYVKDLRSGTWSLIPVVPAYYRAHPRYKGFSGWDMLLTPDGRLLIAEDHGIYTLSADGTSLIPLPLEMPVEKPDFRRIRMDRNGYIWLGSYALGLSRLDPVRGELIHYTDRIIETTGLELAGVRYLEIDARDRIWMRCRNGLLHYLPQEDRMVYTPYRSGESRAFRGMSGFVADQYGSIWGTDDDHGLGYALVDSFEHGFVRWFTEADGLNGTVASQVMAQPDGKLLVFTDRAIQEFDPHTFTFGRSYEYHYGFGALDEAAAFMSGDTLALGKRHAIAMLDLDGFQHNEEIPRPYLTDFRVFGKSLLSGTPMQQFDSVALSHRRNFFSIRFSAIAHSFPDEVRYYYRLHDFDPDWNDGTDLRYAAYTNVPSGSYTFEVKAINSEGLESTPRKLRILITTPWWATWWFRSLVIVLTGGLVYLLYRYRTGQIRREERLQMTFEKKLASAEMSALRAQMNPHFVFNCLNSIDYYIIQNETEKASDYLQSFSHLIRLILQNSRLQQISLHDELEALRLYIEMESLRFNDEFDYVLRIDPEIDLIAIKLPPMLLQPYVENAIWHGLMQKEGKRKLELQVRRSAGMLICTIEDNGIGREAAGRLRSKASVRRKSFGMKITTDRIHMMSKLYAIETQVTVEDLRDNKGSAQGTRVELRIPYSRGQ